MVRIVDFTKEVKVEATRITWPNQKETAMAAIMVFVFAALFGLFFLLVDAVVYRLINFILGF